MHSTYQFLYIFVLLTDMHIQNVRNIVLFALDDVLTIGNELDRERAA